MNIEYSIVAIVIIILAIGINVSSSSSSSSSSIMRNRPKVLVLGGTGFVGGSFIQSAYKQGYDIVSLSRRGNNNDNNNMINKDKENSITWLKGDASSKELIDDIYQKYGPFDSCVHAIGLLFDNPSGLQTFNQYVSGSNSLPDQNATYDIITRLTAFNAIDGLIKQQNNRNNNNNDDDIPIVNSSFIFVSAAEAGWTCKAPVHWLERYLIAKRAVEQKLLNINNTNNTNHYIRPIIFRPSLIWTWKRPSALFSVVPFYIGSKLGFPFIDRPVTVENLVNAMIKVIQDNNAEVGIKNYKDIDRLSVQ